MLEVSDQPARPHITFEAYGVQVQAYASSEELLERVEPMLPPNSRRLNASPDARRLGILEESAGNTYSVYNHTTRVSEGTGLELALVVLEGQIRSWVAVWSPDVIFTHAGCVAHEGRALVFPGASFAGKTTLVAALVRRGALYFSDEFAVIDNEGLVHPYPRPLTIRPPSRTGQRISPVESLGGVAGDQALPLGLAVVTHYVPGAEWQPRRLSPGEGVVSLLSRTVPARKRPQQALEALTRALTREGATVLEGERGEADEFAEMLLNSAVV